MFNFNFCQTFSIDWTTIIISTLSAILGALIAGAFSWLATKQAHKYNQRLKENEDAKESYQTLELLQKIYDEVLHILKSTFDFDFSRSPYGYVSIHHFGSKTVVPLLSNTMNYVSKIKNDTAKTMAIELYAELQIFLEINNMYADVLKKLKDFRKKSLEKDSTIKIIVFDYFNIDEKLYQEENRPEPRLSKDFLEQHKTLIENTKKKSDVLEGVYYALLQKIERFLEINNE